MTSNESAHEAATYVPGAEGPNIPELQQAYTQNLNDVQVYIDQCRQAYDDRRNRWPGKTGFHRKAGAAAVPWEGASDQEAHVISEKAGAIVSSMLYAFRRSSIRAFPVSSDDAGRARLVSSFLKWMRDSYIPGFSDQAELAANYLAEKFLAVFYVGWRRKRTRSLQLLDLEAIFEAEPEFGELILDPVNDPLVIQFLQSHWEVNEQRARRALVELRKSGRAFIPIAVSKVDEPRVRALDPASEVFFPAYTRDPQEAPWVHVRELLTPQQILARVSGEGWSKEWADHVIEHYRGIISDDRVHDGTANHAYDPTSGQYRSELIEVVYTYQRLVDHEDGAEGIYCTVWHPEYIQVPDAAEGEPAYILNAKQGPTFEHFAKHELLEGWSDYPFVVKKCFKQSKQLYDGQSVCELLRGIQWQVKTERDQRIDGGSLRAVPPYLGVRPVDWRPKGFIKGRPGDYEWLKGPPPNPGSVEIERTLLNSADKLLGLDPEDPDMTAKKAYFVDIFLEVLRDVLDMAFKAYQLYGPAELFFRVSGAPESTTMLKDPDEKLNISIGWDEANNDPESVEKKLGALVELIAFDRNGVLDIDALLQILATSIDPSIADHVLRPTEQAAAEVAESTISDWSAIMAGAEMPARPSGARMRLQILGSIMKQPDVQQALAENESLRERAEKYVGQYQFQVTQAQNAQIGQLGTEPAEFQGIKQQS